jgi:hypothetical protein
MASFRQGSFSNDSRGFDAPAALSYGLSIIATGKKQPIEIARAVSKASSWSNAVALVRQMKVNVKTTIKYNGQEYSSMEELPPEARAAYEKAIATGGTSVSTKIVFNGQEYASADQMPAAERQLYEDAIKLTHDSGSVVPAQKEASAGLLTRGQWRLIMLFVAVVLITLIVLLLQR